MSATSRVLLLQFILTLKGSTKVADQTRIVVQVWAKDGGKADIVFGKAKSQNAKPTDIIVNGRDATEIAVTVAVGNRVQQAPPPIQINQQNIIRSVNLQLRATYYPFT